MKLKTDHGDINIPQYFIELFKKAKKEALSKNKDIDFWNQDESECFYDWFLNEDFDFEGRIVDKEIAEFIIIKEVMNVDFSGGYPIENWFSFKDNGFEYNICAFGWTSACEESKGLLNMIGYKEKI